MITIRTVKNGFIVETDDDVNVFNDSATLAEFIKNWGDETHPVVPLPPSACRRAFQKGDIVRNIVMGISDIDHIVEREDDDGVRVVVKCPTDDTLVEWYVAETELVYS